MDMKQFLKASFPEALQILDEQDMSGPAKARCLRLWAAERGMKIPELDLSDIYTI